MNVEPQTQYETTSRNYYPVLILIALLLTISIALTGYQVFSTFQQNEIAAERAATHAERVLAAQDMVETQQTYVMSLMDEYQAAAYDNPSVDRIAEQQLLATEWTLAALQIIAIQNSQVIELLATAP